MDLYFSDHYEVTAATLEDYGAFDISLVSDLPLFVDPFLLFNSKDPVFQGLHSDVLKYLLFLRDEAVPDLDEGLIDSWYRFKEVKQNWFGFTHFGNGGAGLGADFARSLHGALGTILSDFGNERITKSTHLEKLTLIGSGVGKDAISDFTTNLIKSFLCEYTETFARDHIDPAKCATFRVERAKFDYETKSWATVKYVLPQLGDDFVLLTPVDMLTRDQTWINRGDMIKRVPHLPLAISNRELRSKVSLYLRQQLGRKPSAEQKVRAAMATVRQFPELIDVYIRLKENEGDKARSVSAEKVDATRQEFVEQIQQALTALAAKTSFYDSPWTTYHECLVRVRLFKTWMEDQDGYQLFNRKGVHFSNEKELQLAFGLVWGGTELDVNREVNNGRGPVDFKASYGAGDKSLIEFKLASNSQLKRNLEQQVAIYEAANQTDASVKVIVSYTSQQERRVKKILRELELDTDESIVVIDARADNKPSASKAGVTRRRPKARPAVGGPTRTGSRRRRPAS
ncbi:MAG: hypothetical protein WKF96_07945 [Solirubrobacteraceae bacterium]